MAAAASVMFVAAVSQTTVTTALPTIVSDLHGLDHLTWVVTAYLLTSTVGAPIFGKMGDLYGRRKVLQVAILIFLAGSIVAGIAGNMLTLVIARGIQGMGGGGLMVVAMTVIADSLPPRERGKAQGVIGSVFGVSTVIGPLMGGFVVQQFSWHWIFFINLPIGILVLLIINFVLPPTKRVQHEIDYMGAAALAALLSSIVLIASLGGSTFAWVSLPSLALFAVIGLSLVGFIFAEKHAAEPILPLDLFRNNNFLVANAMSTIAGGAMFGSITFIPLYMQVAKGISPTGSGMLLLALMGGLFSASTIAGVIMSRTGRYKILPIFGALMLAMGMAGLSTISQNTSLPLMVTYTLIVGIGIGPIITIGVTAIQNAVPKSMLGVATASVSMFRLIGGSVGVSIFGALFTAGLASRLETILPAGADTNGLNPRMIAALPEALRDQALTAFVAAMQPIFITCTILALITLVISFALQEIELSERDFDKPATAPEPNES